MAGCTRHANGGHGCRMGVSRGKGAIMDRATRTLAAPVESRERNVAGGEAPYNL